MYPELESMGQNSLGTRPWSTGVAWPSVGRPVVTGTTNLPSPRRSEPLGYHPLPQAWTLSLTGRSNDLKDDPSRAREAGRGVGREREERLRASLMLLFMTSGPGEKAEGCPTLVSLSVS